ncbi:DUF1788 domain-containing protein [Prevotella cerevisiae]|uniref:DUF1788 domain-containing protein n=1 Tax=Segatella cerevisiae TaxID=2053716 RepID=A0ABT1BWW3_9BACT|nr:BREX protein BrxB domain-containing protein [Segatella cerevisiae]MCO6025568.1 DUF1788 domain-containing protein [Segatella cerevisiae]
MRSMTIPELYDYLCSPQFQDAKSGNIFYNYYIYQYPARQEYEIRRQIREFQQQLRRPAHFINAVLLDLFEVFCDYLKAETFGNQNLLDMTFQEEKDTPDEVTSELTYEANSDEFFSFVHDRILQYIQEDDGYKHPYVFVYGIGKMFPYLRSNVFLNGYEKYNDTDIYKIILFYPGHSVGNSFSLFDTLPDEHTYRAILLVNE